MQPAPPCPAPACWCQTWAPELLLCWQLWLGPSSVFCFVSFSLLVMLPSEIPKLPHRPTCERVSYCVETSPPPWLPTQHGSPSLTPLSLFVFYILPHLLLKRMSCFSGCLVSSACVHKLSGASCSPFKWSFDESVGAKMVSLSYSSAILGPPPHTMSIKQWRRREKELGQWIQTKLECGQLSLMKLFGARQIIKTKQNKTKKQTKKKIPELTERNWLSLR